MSAELSISDDSPAGQDVWSDFLDGCLHGERVSVQIIGSMAVAHLVANCLRSVGGLVFVTVRQGEDNRFSLSDGCKLVIDGVYVRPTSE